MKSFRVAIFLILFMILPLSKCHASSLAQPLPSLQSYTGIWNMPNARILPDWNMRFEYGKYDIYSYYGTAIGLWGRLEFHGQFTAVNTLKPFGNQGYGYYKDRSAGVRIVLFKENHFLPQTAVGFFDATGTALFANRYLVASKMFGNLDVTIGLGQGILAREFVGGSTSAVYGNSGNAGHKFSFSSPKRKTRPFAGLEYHLTPDLTLSAEYSSIDYGRMFGFLDTNGKTRLKEDDSRIPFNIGIKYKLTKNIHVRIAYMRGNELGFGVSAEFPLNPEGMLGWKKRPEYRATERQRWNSYKADNNALASSICKALDKDGFSHVRIQAASRALWVEAHAGQYLSQARALGRIASIVDQLAPKRITTFYLNLVDMDQIMSSIRTSRGNMEAYMESRMDRRGFLAVSDLTLFADEHRKEFEQGRDVGAMEKGDEPWYFFTVKPRIRTFLDNKKGFFKNKVIIQPRAELYPWSGGLLSGELEFTLYNGYKDVDYAPMEKDAARTDIVQYERKSAPRITELAFDQIVNLPGNIQARGAVGVFESPYAGFGAECFRYFWDGRLGAGLETEWVRKRDIENNFKLRDDRNEWFHTGFVNLYANVWPSQGVEMGLTLGRFLAGDMGARIEVRRSFKYFTIGAWYTKTDTSIFDSPKNRGTDQKGVFISIPIAAFKDHETRGSFEYDITSFLRDPGQTVRQPRSLYPMNPWSTPDDLKRNLDEMR